MRFRNEWLRAGVVGLAVLGVMLALIAALPGSAVTASGAGTVDCDSGSQVFSLQLCGTNTATYASVSDEFDSSASASNWTVVTQRNPAIDSAAFEPYSFTPTSNRYTFGGWRAGWLFVQVRPTVVGGTIEWVGMYRDYSPTSELTIYAQFAFTGASSGVANRFRMALTTSSTTEPNALVGAGCNYEIPVITAPELQVWSNTGASGLTNLDNQPPFTQVMLHRSGNQYWCRGGTDDGRWVYMATNTTVFTPTRLWILFGSSNSTVGAGAALFGLNYVRVIENARVTP